MTGKVTNKLNFLSVSSMYVGVIMGAGFASGRESWQFFGVFGDKAYLGVIIAGIMFALLGLMVSYLAISKDTQDMGKIISFIDNKYISEAIGYFMAVFLYTTIVSMSAAGGSFLYQEFGISKAIGGGIIAILVAVTVLGDFERISGVLKYIVPVLFAVVVFISIIVIFMPIKESGATSGFKPSVLAPNWLIAALIFVAYNIIGTVPIDASASINAKSKKHAYVGSVLGGLMLGVMTFVLVLALQKDMAFTDSLDLPMLGYSLRVSTVANVIYGVVLYAAIYSAATSTFYGFTTKIPDRDWKKYVIIIAIVCGFVLSLLGFKNVVAYLYPCEGYFGLLMIGMIVINFIKEIGKNHGKHQEDK